MDRMGRMDQLDQNHLTIPMSANTMPEYWDNLDPMYSNPDHQHSHPPQHPPAQHQSQPLGISWDHPVFPPQNPPSHAPQDQNHGIYSAAPQSWQPNSITPTPTPAGFGLPQYQQVPHYSQGNVPFDSRSINPSENPSFSPYPFPQHYYPQRLPQQSPIQSAQYPVAARFPEEASVGVLLCTQDIELTGLAYSN